MKVLIELPDEWLDSDLMGNIEWVARTVRQEVKSALVKAIVEQVKIPEIEITPAELKPLVLDKIAEQKASEVSNAE